MVSSRLETGLNIERSRRADLVCFPTVIEDETAAVQSVEAQQIEQVSHAELREIELLAHCHPPTSSLADAHLLAVHQRHGTSPSTVHSTVSLSLSLSADPLLRSSLQLKNLGALPITRIHTTLNMLVPTYKGRTTDELVAFLEAMQAEGLVEKTATGNWKIVK